MAQPPLLITIPLSHYCEKARWALDRAGLPYRESPHTPLLHMFATRRRGGPARGIGFTRIASRLTPPGKKLYSCRVQG